MFCTPNHTQSICAKSIKVLLLNKYGNKIGLVLESSEFSWMSVGEIVRSGCLCVYCVFLAIKLKNTCRFFFLHSCV